MPRAIQDIADDIKKHYEENPTHGVGCSCLDKYVREMRDVLAPLNPRLEERILAGDEGRKIHRAYRHVLILASRPRDW